MRIGVVVGEGDAWHFFENIYQDLVSDYKVDIFKVRRWKWPVLYYRLNYLLLAHDLDAFMKTHDVVFFEWATEQLAVATQLPKRCRVITRLHRYEMFQWASKIKWAGVDKIILVSHAMQNKFMTQFPEQGYKTVSIPVGVPVDKFHPLEKQFSGSLGILCDLIPRKRVYDLILTFYELVQQRPDLNLHIAGGCVTGHEDYYEALHHLVKELDLLDKVTFYDHVTDTLNWYQQIDIFVSNSYSEGLQVAPMEAMASGCYCLSHHWLGAEELLPGENLFYTNTEFKEKVLCFFDLSESEKQRQRARMRAIAVEKFNIGQTKERIREMIEDAK
jgi:glycosyltransferase involved in cell wall biosynthesis